MLTATLSTTNSAITTLQPFTASDESKGRGSGRIYSRQTVGNHFPSVILWDVTDPQNHLKVGRYGEFQMEPLRGRLWIDPTAEYNNLSYVDEIAAEVALIAIHEKHLKAAADLSRAVVERFAA